MEQAQPLSKGKSPVTLLLRDSRGQAARISGPSVREAKLSSDDHPINLLNSLRKTPLKKPSKRSFDDTLATQDYECKFCEAKFSTLQSLGGHQNAHKQERAAKKRARVMIRISNALSRLRIRSNPRCFGMQENPVPGHPIAHRTRTRPSPADVVGPAHRETPKPRTKTNPQAPALYQSAMVNQLNGIVYQPMNNGDPNFCARASPQSTGSRPPQHANVLANGRSFSTQGIENEGLDLTLRL